MKILLTLILTFYVTLAIGQAHKVVLLPTNKVGQITSSTCWAASAQMILNVYSNEEKNSQSRIILNHFQKLSIYADDSLSITSTDTTVQMNRYKKDSNNIYKFIGIIVPTQIPTKHIKHLIKDVMIPKFNSFKVSNRIDSMEFFTKLVQAINDTNYVLEKIDSVGWEILKQNFDNINSSPVLSYKHFSSDGSHITVFRGYEHTKQNTEQMKWIFVNDPWPQNTNTSKGGSQYLTTYEFYKRKIGQDKLFNPLSSLIYNFEYKDSRTKPIKYEDSTTNWNIQGNNFYNIVTNANSSSNDSLRFHSVKVLNHLLNSASDTLLSYVGLQKTGSIVDENDILKLKYIDLKNGVLEKQNVDAGIPNVFKSHLTLFDQVPSFIVPVKNKNTITSVMAFETTSKNQWYTTRVEKYQNSVLQVINDVIAQNLSNPDCPKTIKDIKSVYLNRTYNGSSDFLIIEAKKQNKIVLVDLFGTIPYMNNPQNAGKVGFYNYKIHILNDKKLKMFINYISSTSPKSKPSQKIKASDASIDFIKSFNNLIKIKQDSILKLKADQCPYTCNVFTTNGNDFDTIAVSSKISFISSFNVYNDAYINSFIVPLIDNSNINGVPLYENTYSTTCNKYYKVDSTFRFPKKGYNDAKIGSNFQQIIFVPVETYKTFREKKLDATDFERFQDFAVSPFDMKEIKSPFIESKDGFLGTSNNRDSKNYNDKKSITGLVCEVILKNNEMIQCYVFNRQSFGTSSPYMNWKTKLP